MNYTVINNFLNAFHCELFVIALIHFDKSKPQLRFICTKERINQSLKFYAAKNVQGYNIYIRPQTYNVILLDDVSRESLSELAKLAPCALVETSKDNYQIWFQTSFNPDNREHALQICRKLAQDHDADKGSAEPDHLGRLPSFTNQKEKHKKNGVFPTVILHKFKKRFSTIPLGFAKDYNLSNTHSNNFVGCVLKKKEKQGHDRSRQDFNTCCMLIRQNKSDEFIRNELLKSSQKAQHRKDNYITKTINNARKAVNK
ncbi:DNA-primase RepB domain-containing protein [Bernardetia sp. ABR2-2B]|uniref:DNA-primase RepB domain-containing protein n=1 Tax=Bernardetia sp. ABR2-2B TaxID=3127472 RepID=UPI0030CDB07A